MGARPGTRNRPLQEPVGWGNRGKSTAQFSGTVTTPVEAGVRSWINASDPGRPEP